MQLPEQSSEAPTVTLKPALLEGEVKTVGSSIHARSPRTRTYSFADVTRYVNRMLKGKLNPKERETFFKNAPTAWYQLAPAMSPEQRLSFLKKLAKAFHNAKRRVPTWNPKIDETGEIIVPVSRDDVLAALIIQERAVTKYQAEHGDTTPDQRKEISAQAWRDYVAWATALVNEAATVEVEVLSDVGDKKIWSVKYPDGATTEITLDHSAPAQRARGIAARNWKLHSRIEIRDGVSYLRFSDIKVETVVAAIKACEGDDEKVMQDLTLLQDEIDAVRHWIEENE